MEEVFIKKGALYFEDLYKKIYRVKDRFFIYFDDGGLVAGMVFKEVTESQAYKLQLGYDEVKQVLLEIESNPVLIPIFSD